jgi:hypothetical protein
MGIDKTEGESFTKQNRTDPRTVEPRSAADRAAGDGIRRVDNVKSAGQRYTDNESGLRNKPQGAGTGDTHDIWSDVERNSDKASKTGGPGPIKYGVD